MQEINVLTLKPFPPGPQMQNFKIDSYPQRPQPEYHPDPAPTNPHPTLTINSTRPNSPRVIGQSEVRIILVSAVTLLCFCVSLPKFLWVFSLLQLLHQPLDNPVSIQACSYIMMCSVSASIWRRLCKLMFQSFSNSCSKHCTDLTAVMQQTTLLFDYESVYEKQNVLERQFSQMKGQQ